MGVERALLICQHCPTLLLFFFVLIVEEETDYKAWLAGQRESLPDQSMKEDLSGRYLDIVKLTYLGT